LPQHREAVARALADQALNEPHSITLSDAGFITAEYELDDAELRRLGTPVRSFAERRLLVIRAGLLPFGFRDYRVDVTGSPREAAVVTRYGAALLTESGLMRWVAP